MFEPFNRCQFGAGKPGNDRKSACCIIFPLIVNMAQTVAERASKPKVNVKKLPAQSN